MAQYAILFFYVSVLSPIKKLFAAGGIRSFFDAHTIEIGIRTGQQLIGFVGKNTVVDMAAGTGTLHGQVQRLPGILGQARPRSHRKPRLVLMGTPYRQGPG